MMARLLGTLAAAGLVVMTGSMAGDIVGTKSDGAWTPGLVAPANVGCLQAWLCIPGVDILHDDTTVVVTSPNDKSFGVCSAGDGPADSCNVCLASKPTARCQYWLEKK